MRPYVVVAVGGALGALARYGVQLGLPHSPGAWPWATVAVNLTGCLLIGLLLAVLLARAPDHPWLRPFLATGVLGGYTTFSTFSVDAVQLAEAGRWPMAVVYLLVSVVGGLAAVVLGLGVGRRVAR
ncbi:chromosome condensation protein CrcB [Geodermatophilus sp. Leaf369]|uniref:fluoride efflux transporter CrcB n=1 Tax=Geodermatophilus sp. Leaf369 TaxID=1736354 RepID=UPI0006F20F33|nr:fluoride efflux transporter CrcB [Geodermatophilus sp. Leaf369]KQS58368.1 chromosome condensation protein CrcB [Geodermatophilus sp. Leaf369]